jgi:cell division protein FtsB
MSSLMRSKFFLYTVVILAFLSLTALWREVSGTIKVKRQITAMQQQANELEQRNGQLKQLIGYLDSPEYKEKAAREQLNLQSPGEVVVALPDESTQSVASTNDPAATTAIAPKSNPSAWWNYFFGLKNNGS